MQKHTFVAALREIKKSLQLPEWLTLFRNEFDGAAAGGTVGNDSKAQFNRLAFETQSAVSGMLDAGGPKAEILEAIHLPQIFDPEVLGRYVSAFNSAQKRTALRDDQALWRLRLRLEAVQTLLETALRVFAEASEYLDAAPDDGQILALEIFAPELSPERLGSVLRAVADLCSAIAAIRGHELTPIEIVYLDSGSSKVVGFKVDGTVVEQIRLSFKGIFEYFRFWKERGLERTAEAAVAELRLLDEISEAEEAQTLSREAAERARRSVERSFMTLIESRAVPKSDPLGWDGEEVHLLDTVAAPRQIGPGDGETSEAGEAE